jgi:hypothetical protein
MLAGGLAAVLAGTLFGGQEGKSFFSVTAQVVPVLLLALAFEARLIGTARHYPGQERLATTLESLRRWAAYGMLAVLVAGEWQSLDGLADGGPNDSSLVYAAIAWGFVTVAVVALTGIARPRLTGSLSWFAPASPTDDRDVVLQVEVGNQFGDRDIRPLMNLLMPEGTRVQSSDQDGNTAGRPPVDLLKTPEAIDERFERSVYPAEAILLTAGDHLVRCYRLQLPEDQVKIALRLDHVALKRGRFEVKGEVGGPAGAVR